MRVQKVEIELHETELGRKATHGLQHGMQAVMHMTHAHRKEPGNAMEAIPGPSTNATSTDN